MKLIKILTAAAVAGICVFSVTTANAQGHGQIITNTSPSTMGTLGVTASVAPTATLYLNQAGFIDQAMGTTNPTTVTGTYTPYTSLGFSGFGGDGIDPATTGNGITAGKEIPADGNVYVTLALSTAASSVTLYTTSTPLTGPLSYTIPTNDITYTTTGAAADSNNIGSATWATSGTANDGSSAALGTFTGSGVYMVEQAYRLYVPYGAPSGAYTGTITYAISDF